MSEQRNARMIYKGGRQILLIPPEFELPGKTAIIRREGENLVIEPAPKKSLKALVARIGLENWLR